MSTKVGKTNALDEKSHQSKSRGQTDEAERRSKQIDKYRVFFEKNKEKCCDDDDVTLMRKYLNLIEDVVYKYMMSVNSHIVMNALLYLFTLVYNVP